jgi:tetratricopeptide (TPR) repeat protein
MAEAHQDEIAKLEALYASNPEGRVFTHLAEAYRKAGNRERAHEILEDGLRRHPDSASAYVVLGRVLADGGETEESITAFQQALDRDAGNLVALRWLGDLTVKAGRIDEAIGFYHELIARDPSDINLLDRVSTLEADRAAAMSAPPATDHPAEPVELPPAIESPSGIREAAASLADIEALAASDESAETVEADTGDNAGDVLAALAASARRADPLESLAYEPPAGESPAAEPIAAEPIATEPIAAEPEAYEPVLAEPLAFEGSIDPVAGEAESVFELSIDDITAADNTPDVPEAEVMELSIEDMTSPTPEQSADDFMPDASLALSEPGVDLGGFTDAVGGEVPEITEAAGTPPVPPRAPVTETMAELYRNQGFPERAADVYRQLLRERGSDERIERLLAEIDLEQGGVGDSSPDAALFKQDASGELWLQEVESPWVAGAHDGGLQDTPYAWSDNNSEETGSGAPPIASYFESLLNWRPRSADDAMLLLDEDDAVAETGAAARFMDAPADLPYPATVDDAPDYGAPDSGAPDYGTPDYGAPEFWDTTAEAPNETEAEAVAEATSTGDPWEYADQDTITGTGFGTADEDGVAADPGALDRDTFDTGVGVPAADPYDRLIEAFEPAHEPPAPAAGGEDELMPWETAPSSFGPPATPSTAPDEAMPWEVPLEQAPPAAPAQMPSQAAPEPAADDLMPWETAPAAAMTPPEAAEEPAPWSVADELLPGTSAAGSDWSLGHTGGTMPDGGAGQTPEEEDDEDLEMFRSWLQSLKK